MYVADAGFGALRRTPRDPDLRSVPGFAGFGAHFTVVGGTTTTPLTSIKSKVIKGTMAPTAVEMTALQQQAVGAFVDDNDHPFCTGTLITPHVVLSAAHCGVQVGDRFVIGADAAKPDAFAYVAAVVRDSRWAQTSYDHQLALLDRDLAVEPLPLAPDPPVVGQTVQGVGYGMTDPAASGNTQRWWTAEPIEAVSDRWIGIDGQGRHGLCLGDSGGPLLVPGPAIAGTVSQGAASCTGEDLYSRPDPAWVAHVLAGWASVGRTPPTPLRAWLPTAVGILGVGVAVGLVVAAIRSRR